MECKITIACVSHETLVLFIKLFTVIFMQTNLHY